MKFHPGSRLQNYSSQTVDSADFFSAEEGSSKGDHATGDSAMTATSPTRLPSNQKPKRKVGVSLLIYFVIRSLSVAVSAGATIPLVSFSRIPSRTRPRTHLWRVTMVPAASPVS